MNNTAFSPPAAIAATAARDWITPLCAAGLIFTVGLGLTFWLWCGAQTEARREIDTEFDVRAHELVDKIVQRMQTYIQVLYGVQGLYASADAITRTEFRNYISKQQLASNLSGIQGVSYLPLITESQRQAHIETVRREGFPAYNIEPAGTREWYAPVAYVEPFGGRNLQAFGYDIYSDPVRRAALAHARDSGQVALTGKIFLMQAPGAQPQSGFLIALPLYHNKAPYQTMAERRAALAGWVTAVFRTEDLMAGLGSARSTTLDVKLYDGDKVSAENWMFDSASGQAGQRQRSTLQKISIGNYRLTVQIGAAPGFDHEASARPHLIGGAGVLLSLGLAALTWLLAMGRVRDQQALRRAEIAIDQVQSGALALRAGEARFRSLYDHAPVALWEQDWSAVRAALTELEQAGVEDLSNWLRANPAQSARLAGMVKIVDLNAAALAQVGGGSHKQIGALSMAQNCDLPAFMLALTALARGVLFFACESSYLRLDGVARQNELTLLVMPGHEHTLEFVIVSTLDITERKRMHDELHALATTDFLTSLPNRRDYMARLDAEQARLKRDIGGCAAVLMLDLDHFKLINDDHGHATGDAVLRHIAALMHASLRKIDSLGRVGGEEFAILLPGADLEAAGMFAERLRERVAATPLLWQGESIAVTVSIGIAAMRGTDISHDAALVRADQALYCAKKSGRNRVEYTADWAGQQAHGLPLLYE